MPKLSERRSVDQDALAARARFHLRNARRVAVPTVEGDVDAYIFIPEGRPLRASALVAHGWTSEASFMAVIGQRLANAGIRAVLVDQPGHGKNGRARASLIDCARALFEVAEALGPMHYAVAHSMGCLAVLLAGGGRPPIPRACSFARYVLIAGPNSFSDITGEFGATLGLAPAAQRAYERRIARVARRPLEDFTGARLLAETGRPALLIHARDDAEVRFSCAEEIAALCPQAGIAALDGAGHRAILHDPKAIRAAVAYLTEQ